jgi:hypothetical protein
MEVELGVWYEVHTLTRGNVGFLMRRAKLTGVDFLTTATNGNFSFTLEDDTVITVPINWITFMVDLTVVEEPPPGDGGGGPPDPEDPPAEEPPAEEPSM